MDGSFQGDLFAAARTLLASVYALEHWCQHDVWDTAPHVIKMITIYRLAICSGLLLLAKYPCVATGTGTQ